MIAEEGMMENPDTWGPVEHVIRDAIVRFEYAKEPNTGLSLPREIADALKEAGLLKDDEHVQ